MLNNVVKFVCFLIAKIEFFGKRRAEHTHIRSGRMVCNAFFREANAILNFKSLVGKTVNYHTGAAKSAAGFRNARRSLLVGKSLYLRSGSIGNAGVIILIYVLYIFSLKVKLSSLKKGSIFYERIHRLLHSRRSKGKARGLRQPFPPSPVYQTFRACSRDPKYKNPYRR